MPNTPVTWSGVLFTSNTTTGTRNFPAITQLANGNVVVVWTDFDNNPGSIGDSSPGSDIIGRILDPVGDVVGAEFQLNSFALDDESDPEIVALANGGFMVVYESNGTDNDLHYRTFDSAGVAQFSGTILEDAIGGAVPNSPAVASATATRAMTAYVVKNADGSEDVFVRSYDPSTDLQGAALLKFNGSAAVDENIGGIGLTSLSNNNFALAIGNRNAGNDTISLIILDSAGANLHTATVSPGVEIGAVQCVGLEGGNVAIVYENLTSGTILATVYSSTGAPVRNSFQVSNLTGLQLAPAVCALSDGGFVIVWDDNSNHDILGRRFDATGTTVGFEFFVETNDTQSRPSVVGLADGRFQVAWTAGAAGASIHSKIFDVRDAVNSAPVYTPDQWQVGTGLNDVFTASNSVEIVHGGNGNDTITEVNVGSVQKYFGGSGNDTIIVKSGLTDDARDGGVGFDTVDWSTSGIDGAIFDLAGGLAVKGPTSEVMVNFENIVATNGADTIYGSGSGNTIYGLGGLDTINGLNGSDTVFGGAGADFILGGEGFDTLVGNDNVFLLEADTLFGENGDDFIYAEKSDTVHGGNGLDALYAVNSFGFSLDMGATSFEIAQMDFGDDFVTAASQSVGVTVIGSGGNDTVVGSSFADILFGGVGNDSIAGGNGDDGIVGDLGIDVLDGGEGNDLIYFDNQDSFVFGGNGFDAGYITSGAGVIINAATSSLEFIQDLAPNSNDTILGSTMTTGLTVFSGAGQDIVEGGAFADLFFGGLDTDILTGNGGNDTLVGGVGSDTLSGGAGIDALYGTSGAGGDNAVDIFRFQHSGAANADAVYDFEDTFDKIDLSAFGSAFANVSILNAGGSANVYLNGQIICTVVGIAPAALTADDFIM